MDTVAAKQFLISRVIAEAELERVPLSDVETKMLHFTEVHPSLPDIYGVYAEFERDYNSDEYEKKVAGLLKNARHQDNEHSPTGEQDWNDALEALKEEDHYILVMAGQAFGSNSVSGSVVRRSKLLIYGTVGAGILILLILKLLKN
jgi:hypothetical protein